MNLENEAAQAANALTPWFNGVVAETKELSSDVAAVLEISLHAKRKVSKAAFLRLAELSQDFLTKNSFAIGAGTFFAPGAADGGAHPPEWWTRDAAGTIARLKFNLTPGNDRYYDYAKLPYFSTPALTGQHTVWGPYIDYLGIEEYVLTFSAPVHVDGIFMGVSGCDIRLRDLEPLIMPHLRLIGGNAALINASNRVILGNSGMHLVGDRVKPESPAQHRLALDVPHLGLSLIYTL